jgi:hypothetical protein
MYVILPLIYFKDIVEVAQTGLWLRGRGDPLPGPVAGRPRVWTVTLDRNTLPAMLCYATMSPGVADGHIRQRTGRRVPGT